MKSSRPHLSARRAAVLATGAGLLLTACGSGTPGVAADVDGTRITDAAVDDLAQAFCSIGPGTAAVPATTAQMRLQALQVLLDTELARRVADVDAVAPARVSAATQQALANSAEVPERLRETYETAATEYFEAQYAVIDLGRSRLVEAGQDAAQVTDDAAYQEGDRVLRAYAQDADVHVDPRFGRLVEGSLQPAGGSLSVPVSEFATAATSEDGAEQLSGMLPASQKCG